MTPEEWADETMRPLINALRRDDPARWSTVRSAIADVIREAIEAEREECAKVAESAVARYYVEHIEDDIDIVDATPAYKACEEIRDAIRNRP